MDDVTLVTDPTTQPPADPAPSGDPAPNPADSDWRKGIDPELAKEASLATFKDINDVVKSYVHAQKLIGKNKIVLPDAEYATDEEWREVYKKLGLPEKDKYSVNFGESKYDDEFKKAFTEQAYEAGVLPKQAQKIWDFMHSQIEEAGTKSAQAREDHYKAQVAELQKEWGSGYKAELATAQQAFKQFADEDMIKYFKDSGLAGDVQMIKFLNKIGKSLNEDTFDRNTVKHLGTTKADAQRKIDEVMGNMQHPYWNSAHPSHATAVADMQEYYKVIESTEEE